MLARVVLHLQPRARLLDGGVENLLGRRVGLERLALLDPQEPQLREDQTIPLHDRFALHDLVEAFPIGHPVRWDLTPFQIAGVANGHHLARAIR